MDLGVNTCFESVLKNPYLEKSYQEEKYKLPCQLNFAQMKFDELEQHKDSPLVVFDQGFATHRAFIQLMKDYNARLALESIYCSLEAEFGQAAHVIHVRCSPEEQLKRIDSRGRGFENVDRNFLALLDMYIEAEYDNLYESVDVVDTSTWSFSDYGAFAFEFLMKHRLDTLCNLVKKVV